MKQSPTYEEYGIAFNYHTHTSRCGHAYGEDEEYVKEAIKAGIKRLGFSDHCIFPDMKEPGMRGDFSLLPDYLSSINGLKEKYKGQIEILVGFEAEYTPGRTADYLFDLLQTNKIDYLIQGQHGVVGGTQTRFYGFNRDKVAASKQYLSDVLLGMNSGLYSYLAHPDLFIEWMEWNETAVNIAKTIAEESIKLDMPLELNCGYLRRGLTHPPVDSLTWMHYPYPRFWEIIRDYGAKVTYGIDAHSPSDFYHSASFEVLGLAKQLGLKIVEPKIKKAF